MLEVLNSRIKGDNYFVTADEKKAFLRDGYITLKSVITKEEMQEVEFLFDRFMRGEIKVKGKDFCDMSAGFDREFKDFALVNAMLPRVYLEDVKNNIFEKRAASISQQLLGGDMVLDYDQFLGKKPNKPDAQFAFHQDMGYWPRKTPDTKTATCSLAISQATIEMGCLRVVPGSHTDQKLRIHKPAAESNDKLSGNGQGRSDAHALTLELKENEKIVYCPVEAGDVTVHDEWIVHGSTGNATSNWRKTYVIAFRSAETVKWERANGFTHSHNDTVNWDTFDKLGK